jgi:YARHG domain-containing protein
MSILHQTKTMKSYPALLLVAGMLVTGCHFKSKNNVNDEIINSQPSNKLIGAYVGNFGTTIFTFYILDVEKDSIKGNYESIDNHVILSGKYFTAAITNDGEVYNIKLKGPLNDDKTEGIFTFNISTNDPEAITGNWLVNGGNTALDYSLKKRDFVYSDSVGYYPQSSQRVLLDSDVNNLFKTDLESMRNEIYARHGYCFQRQDNQTFYEHNDWYVPSCINVRDSLTDIEKKNITLIRKYEKTAKDEDFGRQ